MGCGISENPLRSLAVPFVARVVGTFTRSRLDSHSTRLGWNLADVRETELNLHCAGTQAAAD